MSIKDDLKLIAKSVQNLDHGNGGVVEHHQLLWQMACKHRKFLGLTDDDLKEIGEGDMQAMGGGTDKTVPPE